MSFSSSGCFISSKWSNWKQASFFSGSRKICCIRATKYCLCELLLGRLNRRAIMKGVEYVLYGCFSHGCIFSNDVFSISQLIYIFQYHIINVLFSFCRNKNVSVKHLDKHPSQKYSPDKIYAISKVCQWIIYSRLTNSQQSCDTLLKK